MKISLTSNAAVLALLTARADAPGESHKRADRVFAALSQSIITGYLAPKTKLPSEAQLAQHFRVSRPVVREALLRLREEALVESVRGSGSYVCASPDNASAAATAGADISHILHGVELRLVLEPQAAALAALRHTTDDLQRLSLTIDAFAGAVATGEPRHTHDYAFHQGIAQATANPRLLAAIEALEFDVAYAVKVWRHLGRMKPEMRLQDAVDEHRAILEHIREQDAEGARRAMHSHIEKARVRMLARA